MAFKSHWSCAIQFQNYAFPSRGIFCNKPRPQIVSVLPTTNAPLGGLLCALCSVICVGWTFIHSWKTLVRSHHFIEREIWVCKTSILPPLVLVTSQESWTAMHLCVSGIGFASVYYYSITFWICSNCVVFLFFILLIFMELQCTMLCNWPENKQNNICMTVTMVTFKFLIIMLLTEHISY